MEKTNILGVNVDKVTYDEAVDRIMKMLNEPGNHTVFTPNSEIIYMAYKDENFCGILNSADLLTADGIGVVYASKILKNPVPERVAGFDLTCALLEKLLSTIVL
jgi:N-acetylglucosaminyldiphosphoundecaprenol N-acetyl-beta-D-mannosaminyltransferase